MENKLDKLFRNKLEHHSMQPPANAWEKVAAGFPKKNNIPVWVWRMAAAIALMGIVGLTLFTLFDTTQLSELAETNPTIKKDTATANVKVESKTSLKAESMEPIQLVTEKKVVERIEKRAEEKQFTPEVAQVKQPEVNEVAAVSTETVTTSEELNPLPQVEQIQPKVEQQKTRVLVYSLAAVESKPMEEPAKAKPFQRMLTFAKEVKGGETTLASVRNWKDNFLGVDESTRIEKQISNN
jgi:hypothetical protein